MGAPYQPFDHIAGLQGDVPVGCVVTVGRRGPTGAPVDRDRFFIVSPHGETKNFAKFSAITRELHPRFAAWNGAAAKADPATSVLSGNLLFATREQSAISYLRAQQLGKGTGTPPGGGTWETPPSGRPSCTGDGVRAQRFAGVKGGELQYIDITCPHDLCAFRQEDARGGRACKPFARLYFLLRWRDESALPRMLAKWTTSSWHSTRSLIGLLDTVENFARDAGLEHYSLMGLPFTMSLNAKSQAEKKRTFPVVSFSIDGDLVEFFARQAEQLRLAGSTGRRLIGGATSPDEQDPSVVDLDAATVSAIGGIPAAMERPDRHRPEDAGDIDGEVVEDAAVEPAAAGDASDPRSPGDRIRDLAMDLELPMVQVETLCQRITGGPVAALAPLFESQVETAVVALARSR